MLLIKGIYPYEYIDSWERFDEALLPTKGDFYSSLNMEGVTSVDYRHAKRVFKNLNDKNIGDYQYLYVKSNTLFLTDISQNFRKKCIKIYELDLAHFLLAPGPAWPACFKKVGVKLELLTDG